ncbi:MAG: hypothetical protein LBL04_05635 [Bacteroidales bacterium]|jgi:hypothetical protein|nr:hypothetical protein [Bacteroidales bacterium]
MKPFVTFFVSIMLSSVVAGQPYQGGREYKAKNNTYRCEYGIAKSNGRHFYGFTNTNTKNDIFNGWRKTKISDMASERRFFEILYEVYGGKEKMQTMKSETIALDLYIVGGFFANWGMMHNVEELKIVITSETDSPQTTIDQVEAIENLVNGCLFSDEDKYTWGPYTISEIPELLEKMPYQDGKVYPAKIYTYKCKYDGSFQGRHYYTFINTRNILAKINSKTRGEDFEAKKLDSESKLLELLYEVLIHK